MALIRAATPQDAGAIARVHVESWRTTYRGIVPDAFLSALDVEERAGRWRDQLTATLVLVAEEDGDIVGFISGGPIREPVAGCDAELYAIYLILQAQRRGIGTGMLVELARHLDREGFHSMAVWVLADNAAAGFYEGLGAARVAMKEIEIGGVVLPVAVYRWGDLRGIFE